MNDSPACPACGLVRSLHAVATAVAKSNNWPFAYALGYASGRDDCQHQRDPEHHPRERDDYARGYVRGYAAGIAAAVRAERGEV